MQLATVLTPPSPEHLRLAAQCGVTDFVSRYPEEGPGELARVKRHVAAFDLRLTVVEGYLPLEHLKVGQDDGTELEAMKRLIRTMGELEIPILCYNFMAGTDWARTTLDAPARGGARVTAFDLRDARKVRMLGHDASTDYAGPRVDGLRAETLWSNLERLLVELVPVAEAAGVKLSMHPDDPPLPRFLGNDRIMNSVENFERLGRLADSPSNGICFCQGNFVAMGVDPSEAIRRLGSRINYVHFRDVEGTAECFTETFHDNGPTDMVAAVESLKRAGFDGPIRPDHVPQLVGEEDGEPGYTMLGRLFAYGYIRGLIQAAQRE